jgi:hypothetical protein
MFTCILSLYTHTILMGCLHFVTQNYINTEYTIKIMTQFLVQSSHMWLQLYGHGHTRTHSNMVQCELMETLDENFAMINFTDFKYFIYKP